MAQAMGKGGAKEAEAPVGAEEALTPLARLTASVAPPTHGLAGCRFNREWLGASPYVGWASPTDRKLLWWAVPALQ